MSDISEHDIHAEDLLSAVEDRGLLVHKEGKGHIEFQFTYAGYPFAVRAEAGPHGTFINIRAMLGYLPYTAESKRGRAAAAKIFNAASRALGQRVTLEKNQQLIMRSKRSSLDPLTPVNLLAMITVMLLEAKPFFELLSEYVKPTLLSQQTALPAPDMLTPQSDSSAA